MFLERTDSAGIPVMMTMPVSLDNILTELRMGKRYSKVSEMAADLVTSKRSKKIAEKIAQIEDHKDVSLKAINNVIEGSLCDYRSLLLKVWLDGYVHGISSP